MSDPPGSAAWRQLARGHLLDFAERSWRDEGGFGHLHADGSIDPDRPPELWINARMTYVFSLATLLGDDRSEVASHGVEALAELFHDDQHGGWFTGTGISTKNCYEHAFVIIAACTANAAGVDGARALLEESLAVHGAHFWDEASGRCVEQLSADWQLLDPYRGANSNMHTVEAYLFAADASGNDVWRSRALSICERFISQIARSNNWRLPEHFDSDWTPLPDYNQNRPDDAFRPYGATPGHGLEWARLLLQLSAGSNAPEPWLLPAAIELFDRAVADAVTAAPGLPYTTDWAGRPIVAERFHWVMAEAILAADALTRATGDERFNHLMQRWWHEVEAYFVDVRSGSWHHELSPTMGPSSRTWSGQPDAFHIMNALTLPDLPLAPTTPLSAGRIES